MMINIDLPSWEIGYADGQFGRPFQCQGNLDRLSYSSGYCNGRADHAGARNQPARRPAPGPHRWFCAFAVTDQTCPRRAIRRLRRNPPLASRLLADYAIANPPYGLRRRRR